MRRRKLVWATDRRDQWLGARKTTERVAKLRGEKVIMCADCKEKPATTLDHYYPYHSEMNKCDGCLKKYVDQGARNAS